MDYRGVRILYEDNHILVVVKPPNMLAQGDSTGDLDLLTLMKEYIKVTYDKPGNVYLGLVHRLDRPVGGVMVFAKTSKAAARLSQQIREREMGRVYLAVVRGIPRHDTAVLQDYLLKDPRTNLVRVVGPNTPQAKLGRLTYEVLESRGSLSLVRVEIHTGRSHQIRVQLANAGFPLIGDARYGRGEAKLPIALWAWRLRLIHPTRKTAMEFTAEPPRRYPWNQFKEA
ncbi:MAG: RluA family pseudouridine synthase [Limnochordia bacterium]|jgi:23S rRNA pseudouridine1911/1915/1917 synthase